MRALIIVFLSLISSITFAQESASWLGGAPGNESNWNDARNWSSHDVPDEDTHVIIKYTNSGHHAMPIIETTITAASISIYPNATLTIEEKGALLIDGTYLFTEGISFYGGQLINKGAIYISNLDIAIAPDFVNNIQNTGRIVLDNSNLTDTEDNGHLDRVLAKRNEREY